MAGNTRITFAQDGQEPITFEISSQMMDKIYRKIDQINSSPVLGQTVSGAADWWMKEAGAKIITPLVEEFPDPDPAGIIELQAQIDTIQSQIAQMKRDAFISPIIVVPPEG